MSTLRLLPRLAAAKPSIQTSVCPRRVCSSSLGLHVRGTKPISRTVVRPFHNTASASISQATKDKVNERNELFKRNNDIEARVKKIISEQLGLKSEEVVNTASFVEDLGADSLDTVELIMALEEEFDTDYSDEEAERITTGKSLS